jgi:hypothetical protein
MATYPELHSLRSNVDLKTNNLYNPEYIPTYNHSTQYASILWAVLATSLIYYIFVKL